MTEEQTQTEEQTEEQSEYIPSAYEKLLALLEPEASKQRERTLNTKTLVPDHPFTVDRALQMLRRTRGSNEAAPYGLPSQFVFYAHVVGSLERVMTTAIDTFAIGPYKNRFALYINPYLGAMPLGELIASLEHEMCHVVLGHDVRRIQTRKMYPSMQEAFLHGLLHPIATDAAINDMLRSTYPEMEDPAQPFGYWILPEDTIPSLPRGGTYETYLHTMVTHGLEQVENPKRVYELALRVLRMKYADRVSEYAKTETSDDMPRA